MAQDSGITIERTLRGKPTFARINLRKYGRELESFFREKGIVLEETNFSQKLRNAMQEIENGEYKVGDINNFWDD